jgi:hypothetical protein
MKNADDILQLMQAADTDKSGTINYTGKPYKKYYF